MPYRPTLFFPEPSLGGLTSGFGAMSHLFGRDIG